MLTPAAKKREPGPGQEEEGRRKEQGRQGGRQASGRGCLQLVFPLAIMDLERRREEEGQAGSMEKKRLKAFISGRLMTSFLPRLGRKGPGSFLSALSLISPQGEEGRGTWLCSPSMVNSPSACLLPAFPLASTLHAYAVLPFAWLPACLLLSPRLPFPACHFAHIFLALYTHCNTHFYTALCRLPPVKKAEKHATIITKKEEEEEEGRKEAG